MKYNNIREEELKNKIAQDYFGSFDCTKIIGNVDFCVSVRNKKQNPQNQDFDHLKGVSAIGDSPARGGVNEVDWGFDQTQSLLWAEAKKGKSDIINSIVQLILTIGKARTFDRQLPPAFLGAFDGFQMAFLPYNDIQEVFYQNDFNWNVTPSNYETKEFKQLHQSVNHIIQDKSLLFVFGTDDQEIKEFIQNNITAANSDLSKIQIDKNNFFTIYNKWLKTVKPTINFPWENGKKHGIMDSDFYLADLFSDKNETIKDGLYAVLKNNIYELDRKIDIEGFFNSKKASFNDGQKAHNQFWNRYERPPKKEYWDYIIERKELLLPQDVRERKGSFFTPQIWVELSQQYLADTLGENWQDEYYIWDCAAGTGNLLRGLVNKYNIWASTLDQSDVDAMKDLVKSGYNLLESHCFQFDFLNDEFTKLPAELQKIINDPEKRKKLVMYINPPYAEHGNRSTISAHGEHKSNVSTETKVYKDFNQTVGTGTRELFAQFFLRIYRDIPDAKLASFSTLKFVNSQNFFKFRQYFKAEFEKGFICKANTFDNVKGNFPICFLIWNFSIKNEITKVDANVVLCDNNQTICFEEGIKSFYSFGTKDFISVWLRKFYDEKSSELGYLILPGIDMQQQNGVYITTKPTESDIKQHKTAKITKNNLVEILVYLAVRHCIEHTWINHNDQFLFPNDGWKTDQEFQNDCLTFALFHNKNSIQSKFGINHWIPFTEKEVNAREKFESNFMTDYIAGKLGVKTSPIETETEINLELENSPSLVKGWQSQTDGVVLNTPQNQTKFISLPYNPKLKTKAKELRQASNLSEVILWNMVKNKQLLGLDFDRQKIIGNYIVDFYCTKLGLVIEIDGESHDFKGQYDVEREQFLKSFGLEVIHFEDIALKKDSATVGQQLFEVCGRLLSELDYQLPRQSAIATPSQAKGNSPDINLPIFEDDYSSSLFPHHKIDFIPSQQLEFSPEAKAVFDAGRELWRYYHQQHRTPTHQDSPSFVKGWQSQTDGVVYNSNASLYDIREYFQGRNNSGKMNSRSEDEKYTTLILALREALKVLATKIQPKVYEYGFLKV